ncbi:MAG: bifunctional precorrin-2 dehydrogenase/sirohydrochlorin ferrochelatase [Pseudomonadota bacterium]
MHYYPVNLDLNGRKCIVFGGGRVAERKVARLLECGARVVVVAPELTPRLAGLTSSGRLEHLASTYQEDYLAGAFLTIGATNSEAINAAVSQACGKAGILCNIADDPEKCSFTLPALVQRGDFCLAISTGGKSPALAKRTRLEMERLYGDEYAEFVDLMGRVRDRVLSREHFEDEAARAQMFERLAGSELPRLIKFRDRAAIDTLLRDLLGEGFSLAELLGSSENGAKWQ